MKKQINPTAPPAAEAPAPKPSKCQAKDVGHRRCNCGSPHCGANIGGR